MLCEKQICITSRMSLLSDVFGLTTDRLNWQLDGCSSCSCSYSYSYSYSYSTSFTITVITNVTIAIIHPCLGQLTELVGRFVFHQFFYFIIFYLFVCGMVTAWAPTWEFNLQQLLACQCGTLPRHILCFIELPVTPTREWAPDFLVVAAVSWAVSFQGNGSSLAFR